MFTEMCALAFQQLMLIFGGGEHGIMLTGKAS